MHVTFSPWFDGWGPVSFGGFGPVTRLVGSTFRFGLLALLACVALVIARRPVEGSASRVADNPVKATLVGVAAWVLFAPLMLATAFVLAISIVGIPLLLLLPFAVLALLVMALIGFSGTAYAVGQWTRRRFGIGAVPAGVDVCLGILVIMLPLLLGRVLALVRMAAQSDRLPAGGRRSAGGVPRVVQRVGGGAHECLRPLAGQARDADAPVVVPPETP